LDVEACGTRTDSRAIDPWVVQVGLSTLDQEDLELVVQICQAGIQVNGYQRGIRGGKEADRPATTHPQLPPPHTIISTSSGTVILNDVIFVQMVWFFCF
jgi:hypothetical protein